MDVGGSATTIRMEIQFGRDGHNVGGLRMKKVEAQLPLQGRWVEVEGPGERWYGLNSFKRVSLDSYLQLQPFISARPKSRHLQPFRTDDITTHRRRGRSLR